MIIIETILKKLGWENNLTNRRLVVWFALFFFILLIMVIYIVFSFISWTLNKRKRKKRAKPKR